MAMLQYVTLLLLQKECMLILTNPHWKFKMWSRISIFYSSII